MSVPPHASHFKGGSISTIVFPHAWQWKAGMRCPHQICREMHQSWMFSIHSKYVFSHCAGTIRVSPSRTARMAAAASGFVFTNHCVLSAGSTTVRHR
jgi:hypothetical protein